MIQESHSESSSVRSPQLKFTTHSYLLEQNYCQSVRKTVSVEYGIPMRSTTSLTIILTSQIGNPTTQDEQLKCDDTVMNMCILEFWIGTMFHEIPPDK